jgi:hypothetical protein
MDNMLLAIDRINHAMFNIDSTGVKALQISNKVFISGRTGKGIIL